MLRLKDIKIVCSLEELAAIPEGKVLINTINAHSYNTAQKDELFAKSLTPRSAEGRLQGKNPSPKGEGNFKREEDCVKYLIPDGASVVKACRWLKAKSQPKERIAGWDLFEFEMGRLEAPLNPPRRGKPVAFFMGSSEKVLGLIREKAKVVYPHIEVVTYSPPYKPEFSDEDNAAIVKAINDAKPDLLWIGMTAPKQEKWAYSHWNELNIHCHCGTIGAVFDFFAGTAKRAPKWWQEHSLEWLYRLIIEPKRMWRRYIIGNALFIWNIWKEK